MKSPVSLKVSLTCFLVIALFSLVLVSCSEKDEVVLVRRGKPVMTVLVDGSILPLDQPLPELQKNERGEVTTVDRVYEQRRAVREFLKYVREMSGAGLAVEAAAPGMTGCYIGLGFPWLDQVPGDLGAEGFIIRTEGKNLYILANEPLGVRHAVTTFLKEQGCRWFFPGTNWEIVPERKTIKGKYDILQKPSFSTARSMWYGFGTNPKSAADQEEWNYHNNMGGPGPVNIGHTWYGIDPEKDFKLHPRWFALVKGKRSNSKVCYSDPEVISKMIAYSMNLAASGVKSISLTPADGLGYCECSECSRWAGGGRIKEERGSFFATRSDSTLVCTISESLFDAVNKVAREVGKKYPEVIFGCYGYSAYSHPPSFKLEPNIFIQTTTEFRRTPLSLEDQINMWGDRAKQVGIRGYWSVYQWDWDNPYVGSFTPEKIRKDLQLYKDHNVTAFNTEASNNWAARGLSYYAGSKLLWNTDADVKSVIEDFYSKAFGPAASPMERYYARWYGESVQVSGKKDQGTKENIDEGAAAGELADKNPRGSAATKVSLKKAFLDLDEAADLVSDKPEYLRRVDDIRMYAYYLLLREKVKEASESGNNDAIILAVRNETEFGGRLASTNMIHAKPLLGKAFLRLFKPYQALLDEIPETRTEGQGWRTEGNPPSHEELEKLWDEGKKYLGI